MGPLLASVADEELIPNAQPRGGWLSVGVPSVLGVLQKVELQMAAAWRWLWGLGFRVWGSGFRISIL